jgi:hypothetical protein
MTASRARTGQFVTTGDGRELHPTRKLSIVNPDDPALRHVSVVGDTYTILLSGAETAGRYCLIDMNVAPKYSTELLKP